MCVSESLCTVQQEPTRGLSTEYPHCIFTPPSLFLSPFLFSLSFSFPLFFAAAHFFLPLLYLPPPPPPPSSSLQDTFVRAKSWVKELQRQASPNIVIALSGNKADLASKRMVDFEVQYMYTNTWLGCGRNTDSNISYMYTPNHACTCTCTCIYMCMYIFILAI